MSEQCLGPSSGTSLDAAKIRIVGANNTNTPAVVVGTTPETTSVRDSNNNNNNNIIENQSTSGEYAAQSTAELHSHKKLAESGKVSLSSSTTTTTTLEFVSGDTSEHYFTVASGTPFDYRDYLFDNTNSDLLDSAGPTPPGSADGGLSSKNSSNADTVTGTSFDFDLSGEVPNRIPSLVTVGAAGACESDIGSPPIENAANQLSLSHQERHQQQSQQQHRQQTSGQQQQQQQNNNLLLFDTTMLDAGSCGVAGSGTVGQQAHGGDVHDDSQQHSYVYNTPPPVLESSITSVQEHTHHHHSHQSLEMETNAQQQQSYYTLNGSENDPNNNPVVGPEDDLKMIHDEQMMSHHFDSSEQRHTATVTDPNEPVFHHNTVTSSVDVSSSNGTSAQQTSSMEFEHQQQVEQQQQQQLQQQTHQHIQQTLTSQLHSSDSKNNTNEHQIDSNEPLYQGVASNSANSQQQQVASFMPSADGVLTLGTNNVITTHVGNATTTSAGNSTDAANQQSLQQPSAQQQPQIQKAQAPGPEIPNGSSSGTISQSQTSNTNVEQQNRLNVYVTEQCSQVQGQQSQTSQQQQQQRQLSQQPSQQSCQQQQQTTRYVNVPLRSQSSQQALTSVTASNESNASHPQQHQQVQQVQTLPRISSAQIATLTRMPTTTIPPVSPQIKQICVISNSLASPNHNITIDCSSSTSGSPAIPTFTTLITQKKPVATSVTTCASGSLQVSTNQPLHATTFPAVNTSSTGTLMFASKSTVPTAAATKSNVPTMIALPATQFVGTDTGQWTGTPTYLQPTEYATTAEAVLQPQQHSGQHHQTLQAYPVLGSQYERLPDDGAGSQQQTQIFLSPGPGTNVPGTTGQHSNIRIIDPNYSIVALPATPGISQPMSVHGQPFHSGPQTIQLSSSPANKPTTKLFITTPHSITDDGQATIVQQSSLTPQHAQIHAGPQTQPQIHLQASSGPPGGNTLFQLTPSRSGPGGSISHAGLPTGSIILSSINYNVAGAPTGQPIAATNFAVPIPVVTMAQTTPTIPGTAGQQVVFTTTTPTNGAMAGAGALPPTAVVTATKTKGKKSRTAAVNKNIITTSSSKLNPPPLPSGDTAKPYKCSICHKNLASKNVYQLHLRSHSGEKPFECNVCNNRFSQKTSLTRHYRSHTGERPFPCSVCQKRFADKERIKIHMRIHTGEKPFSCQICHKKFSQKSTVKRHMSVHTGVKPFKCETCGKGFANRGNLTAHTKTHQPSNGGASQQTSTLRPQARHRNSQAAAGNRLATVANAGSQQIQLQNPISTTQVILNANGAQGHTGTGEVIAIKLNPIKPEIKTEIMELAGGQQFVVTPITQVSQQQLQTTQDRTQSQPTSIAPLSS